MPVPYFITFRTYATWLHGDERGSVDRQCNVPGTPVVPVDVDRQRLEAEIAGEPVELDEPMRRIVEATVREVAGHRLWALHAVNVRTNHVHVVISADRTPERVMNDLKAWATRRLVEAGLIEQGAKVWARHGSTRYLDTAKSLSRAIEYVLYEQGEELI